LLALLLMTSVAATLLVYGSTTEAGRTVKSERKTRATLEYARQALIGRAIGDASRPGSLPCPDGDDDGSADLFVGASCPTYIGRLPWRTLGIGDLRDDSGERLWYALAPPFRDHPAAPALNSDSRGTLTIYAGNDSTRLTREAIAVVFAPGPLLAGQQRGPETAQCATNGKHIPRNECAANYLDAIAGFTNAANAGPYISATPAPPLYNDRLTYIAAGDFMPLVEQRVAIEVREALLAYKKTSVCRCYPWADSSGDRRSDAGSSRGRIPVLKALPEDWRPEVLPAYFAPNEWDRVITYSAARAAVENSGAECKTCVHPNLTVDGTPGYELVLLTTGFVQSESPRLSLSDYVDDAENRNADDIYVTPVSGTADRDRLYGVATRSAGCVANARVLLQNLPCRNTQGAPRPACESATAALAACTCAPAAMMLAKGPCAGALGAAECPAALNQLQACTS
jgi:hypothetical protein